MRYEGDYGHGTARRAGSGADGGNSDDDSNVGNPSAGGNTDVASASAGNDAGAGSNAGDADVDSNAGDADAGSNAGDASDNAGATTGETRADTDAAADKDPGDRGGAPPRVARALARGDRRRGGHRRRGRVPGRRLDRPA